MSEDKSPSPAVDTSKYIAGYPLLSVCECPLSSSPDTSFVICSGGGGSSRTGVHNGAHLLSVSLSDSEPLLHPVIPLADVHNMVISSSAICASCGRPASFISGPIDHSSCRKKRAFVSLAHGTNLTFMSLSLDSDSKDKVKSDTIASVVPFPKKDSQSEDDDSTEPSAAALFQNSCGTRCVVGSSGGKVVVMSVASAPGKVSELEMPDKTGGVKAVGASGDGSVLFVLTQSDGCVRFYAQEKGKESYKSIGAVKAGDFGKKQEGMRIKNAGIDQEGKQMIVSMIASRPGGGGAIGWIELEEKEEEKGKRVLPVCKSVSDVAAVGCSCCAVSGNNCLWGAAEGDLLGLILPVKRKAIQVWREREWHGLVSTGACILELEEKEEKEEREEKKKNKKTRAVAVSIGADGVCRTRYAQGGQLGRGMKELMTLGAIVVVACAIILSMIYGYGSKDLK